MLSVVIGTYNQRAVLQKTLESLFNQTLSSQEYEIVLVDSFSDDGTDRMVETLKPTCRLNYLRTDNFGKSYARNIGIRAAKGEIIFLTDADMEADQGLLEKHAAAHKNTPGSIFEGLTINPNGKPYIQQILKPDQPLKWSYFLTGNLSIAKESLLKVGLFDEKFRGYGWEDIELGYRLSKLGVKLFYLPSAINYHRHPVSQEGMQKRKYEMGKSAAYFYRKHPNFEIKMFLGMNPLAMGTFQFLKNHPALLEKINNQYILEEYYYRLGLTEALKS
ncbi:MAG: glycosyltransferase [Candidatus Margulisiibacteriota bacterium]